MFDPAALARTGTLLFDTARATPENEWSWCFADPERVLIAEDPGEVRDLFDALDAALESGRYVAGALAYEAGYPLVDLPDEPLSREPLAWFGVYDGPERLPPSTVEGALQSLPATGSAYDVRFSIAKDAYCADVDRIRHHICEGDVYQINYTGPVRFQWSGDPRALYRTVRKRQRVPYGAFLNLGDAHVLSWSPELFFRKQGRTLVTRPMKGTIRRGATNAEDQVLREQLASDPKNRAENLMIVDLLRNDLSRCCRTGSVHVPDLFTTETYDTVTQMTSTVKGTLHDDAGLSDVFAALFPCGSVTGAPKRRAMRLIRELERGPRGVYCGAIGFAGPDDAVFNVPIRTARLGANGRGRMGVGSGIVWDSTPAAEYDECQLKAQFLAMDADDEFRLIESMRFDGLTVPLLDRHVERMERSADHFGMPFEPDRFRNCVQAAVEDCGVDEVRKVRVTLDRKGRFDVTTEPIDEHDDGPRQFMVTGVTVDSGNELLRHKTTRRDVHERAQREAEAAGADEAVLVNERGEVTEGTWSNLFVQQGDQYVTPPVSCGLLPGVFRERLLDTQPHTTEAVVTVDDLSQADAVFCCNAVRGWRRAVLAEPQRDAA